ncbi:hypothetical protein ASG43_05495 [Aureimonas sp. Leaf454]|uniref:2-dehydro-3-deoxygalactonokinase n=1 Tax=Aureimonas sp. Leaf454 TaxID=1736381 RepID=UPI0006F89887|nr:2-dehydro-3-deoxygalactonokinase [Aureimonas sp. Leaf454]KQT50733.1 hypothetical protein ASG43_05495 [Aureimonas sp. Leaf454]
MSASPGSAVFAAVDWGTSSLRVWLLGPDGTVLGERRSREGMQVAAETGFRAILEDHLRALDASSGLPVVICGMAGARQGWVEAPYVETPASFDELASGAIAVEGLTREVRILPGVAQKAGGRPDVMRGEETIVVGLAGGSDALVCLPGTHSKWVDVRERRIMGFSTFMTGETYALLAGHSILRHAIDGDVDILSERDAFAAGIEASIKAPDLTLNRLFALRAAGLLGAAGTAESAARLSGLVIGLELAGARRLHPGSETVRLAASGVMLDLYSTALGVAGFSYEAADADEAVRRGLFAAGRQLFPELAASAR